MGISHKPQNDLLNAAWNGQADKIEELLSKGWHVDVVDDVSATPLIYAAFNGHPIVIQYLISKGAKVNTKDLAGRSALFYAALKGHTEAVRVLLSNGADVNSNDEDGRTVLLMAMSLGYREIVCLLKRGGAIFDSMLQYTQGEKVHQVRPSDRTNLGSFSFRNEVGIEKVNQMRRFFKRDENKMSFWSRLFGKNKGEGSKSQNKNADQHHRNGSMPPGQDIPGLSISPRLVSGLGFVYVGMGLNENTKKVLGEQTPDVYQSINPEFSRELLKIKPDIRIIHSFCSNQQEGLDLITKQNVNVAIQTRDIAVGISSQSSAKVPIKVLIATWFTEPKSGEEPAIIVVNDEIVPEK